MRERTAGVGGEGYLVGWGLLTGWGLVSLSLDVAPLPGGALGVSAGTSLASVLGCLVLTLAARAWPGVVSALSPRGRAVWVAAAVVSTCSLGNQLAWQLGLPGLVAITLQAVASIAYIALMCAWFARYVVCDPQGIEERAVWSTALCAGVCLLAMLLPYPATLVVLAALPLASAWCLATSAKSGLPCPAKVGAVDGGGPSGGRAARRTPSPGRLAPLGIALCSFALAGAGGLVSLTSLAAHDGIVRLGNLGGLALAAVLVLWYLASARRIDLQSLYRLLYPLAAVGMFLLALPFEMPAAVGYALCVAGQWALYVFIWVYATERCGAVDAWRPFVTARVAFDGSGALACLAVMVLTRFTGAGDGGGLMPYLLFATLVLLMFTSVIPVDLGDPEAAADRSGAGSQPGSLPADGSDLASVIDARAGRLAEQFGLSQRESQILALLLRGHSTASIRNELAIAKGTVDTYIQRIYRKCGVHSRQELAELAEGRSPSPAPELGVRG